MAGKDRSTPGCFLALPFSPEFEPVKEAVERGVRDAGFRPVSMAELGPRPTTLMESLMEALREADCVIADVTEGPPNILLEVGLAMGMGKPVFLLAEARPKGRVQDDLPFDLAGIHRFAYRLSPRGMEELSAQVSRALEEFRGSPTARFAPPWKGDRLGFSVDWDRLDRSDAENLCLELLSQMGFVNLDWDKGSPGVDLAAELPKKDPDGFEYRELWLVSLGRLGPPEMLMKMAAEEPDYFMHRLLRRRWPMKQWRRGAEGTLPVTLLFVLFESSRRSEVIEEHFRELLYRSDPHPKGVGLRVRVWDRNYLTSLVQRFPQVAYKYFSDEGRARAKFRKTPEELYRENVELVERQAKLIAELEDEKNRRVRAERDAVWKDISFSAAHKIGNPIFAIETNLDPLQKRVDEDRRGEAAEVIGSIRASVEKAKAIIDQFKSLTKAQQIELAETALRPILDDPCATARNQGVECAIECPAEMKVSGDPERLAECFDELVNNALHWLDKPERRISIQVGEPPLPLPPFVDSTGKYALVHFKDNGSGVPIPNKDRIFDAFFTTQDHGTGLGLALVRRIIEGHGGVIVESGIPGQGADFEIYLPLCGEGAAKAARPPAAGRQKEEG